VGAGAVSGLLDILIVGSVFHDMSKDDSAPAAILWVLGSILLNAVVAGAGGAIGSFVPGKRRESIRWTQVFAIVLAAATLPLITAGGLVTAFHAGLAVPDWPRSYGYNMFLFPLSKMQSAQGNFYEHAHRLMGSLVGFTALVLAIYFTLAERRRWVKGFAWTIGFCILVQAILGGFRVTEKSVPLAIAHGIFAQLVFASMAALAAVAGNTFLLRPPETRHTASIDRFWTSTLLGALVVQLFLGALVRHEDSQVLLHITMAGAVTLLVLTCGFRAWGLYGDLPVLKRSGLLLMLLVLVQLTLGVLALIFRSGPKGTPTVGGAMLTTAHQANGALLLATAAVLWVCTRRLLIQSPQEAPGADAAENVLPAAL
jgi:cytochrome c oxidase assembly protein subunit 15